MRIQDTEEYAALCGACQKWGCDPLIESGKCTICERSMEMIVKEHGALSKTLKARIKANLSEIVSEHLWGGCGHLNQEG